MYYSIQNCINFYIIFFINRIADILNYFLGDFVPSVSLLLSDISALWRLVNSMTPLDSPPPPS